MRNSYLVYFFLGACCFFSHETLLAQQVNFDQIVPPSEMKARNFEDYLVQLAWQNNPSNRALEAKKTIAQEEYQLSRKNWMKSVNAGFNLNEVSLANVIGNARNTNDPSTTFIAFPLYTLNATVSLATLLNTKHEKNIANANIQIAENDINQEKLGIRAETLSRYQEYLLSNEVLKTRLKSEEDAFSTYSLVGQLFQVNKAKFEEFNDASQSYYGTKESRIRAESEVSISKYKLEEITGQKWETLERYKKLMEGLDK